MASGRSMSVRKRAPQRNRRGVRVARIAVAMLAFCLTSAWLVTKPEPDLFDATLAATIAGALLTVAIGVLALMAQRNRLQAADLAHLESELETLEDRNWELKEAAQRGRTFLEALVDVIVRRDANGAVTYANDAYARL